MSAVEKGEKWKIRISFNDLINFGIPGLIFQIKVIEFGTIWCTNVGLHMLIDISSRIYHN